MSPEKKWNGFSEPCRDFEKARQPFVLTNSARMSGPSIALAAHVTDCPGL